MTDLVILFKEKADAFLAAINQKGGVRATIEGLRRQMAEADRRRAIGRVKAELRRLDRQINEMITAVGVQAVALQEAGRLTSPELQPLCQHISDLKATLSQQKAELAELEVMASTPAVPAAVPAVGEAATCGGCGRPVPAGGGAFCPYCGEAVVSGTAPAPGVAVASRRSPETRPAATTEAAAALKPICAHCGAPLKPGAKFCSKCGRAV